MIFLPKNHPSIERLKAQGIDATDKRPAANAAKIAILNLMPQKQEAEEELYVSISHAAIDLDITLLKMSGLTYKTTPQEYMDTYYTDVAEVLEKGEMFDGLIVNGAPFDAIKFEDVFYWKQLHDVYRWTFTNVRSTLNICWGAFASLQMFFGAGMHWTEEKLFGIYPHKNLHSELPILEGLPLEVPVPISRHVTLYKEELTRCPELTILLDQDVTGPEMAIAWNGRHIFANGHMEYAEGRLRFEYERDMAKGLPIGVPYNYFNNDDPKQGVNVSWQKSGRRFFSNWLKYYACNKELVMEPKSFEFVR